LPVTAFATGRGPAIANLSLTAAGVRTTARGAIEVNEHLRTTQPHIFALGDVNGGPRFTYVSLDDARIVLDQLLGEGHDITATELPDSIYTHPSSTEAFNEVFDKVVD
jgi:probable pyridine nucleotide-disulfide oxidoreductase